MNDQEQHTCWSCDECVYLGEGDFACMVRDYELVIVDWVTERPPCEKWVDGDAE